MSSSVPHPETILLVNVYAWAAQPIVVFFSRIWYVRVGVPALGHPLVLVVVPVLDTDGRVLL